MRTQGLFYNCHALEYVVFPAGIRIIEFQAFGNNSTLKFVVFTGSTPPVFENTNNLTVQTGIKLYVLDSYYDDYATAGWSKDVYLNYGGDRFRKFSKLAGDYPADCQKCIELVGRYTEK